MEHILIVEDDKALADGLVRALSSQENVAFCCGSMEEARHRLAYEAYSLILLDINLPDGSGFDFLKQIKEKYSIPVILLTANDLETDIVSGLEHGADDYITKPFSLAILRARVNTQLRRNAISQDAASRTSGRTVFVSGGYRFDFEKMEFSRAGTSVELSKTEQKLLRILVENAENIVARDRLIDYVWTDGAQFVDENALSVAVKRLRDKLCAQDCIKTVYGIGYSWKMPE